jgi:hypothetical protein
MSEDLRELVTRRTDAVAERDIALAGILKVPLSTPLSLHFAWNYFLQQSEGPHNHFPLLERRM